jgi:hypothetical protein
VHVGRKVQPPSRGKVGGFAVGYVASAIHFKTNSAMFIVAIFDLQSRLAAQFNLTFMGFQRFSNKALPMTLSELIAIAAPASTGFK